MQPGARANIKAVITAEDRASRTLQNFGNQTSRLGATLKRAFLAGGAAAAAFGVTSIKAYSESEDALAQLNAVLKSTKGVAGVTADQVQNLATQLQRVTKFSDEEIISAQSLLLTFTKINKKIFPETTEIVLDMSQALGQDLKSSAIQLGKALQDPILGVTALRRVGVNFNDAQREVIKKLVETGRSAEAQRLILKELRVEFGGSAKAAGETFSGQLTILKNRFNDLQESVGNFLVRGLVKLSDTFTKHKGITDIVTFSLDQMNAATKRVKEAQELAKETAERVKDSQNKYNDAVANFGPKSDVAREALKKLRSDQIKDAQARASSLFQQKLLNSAEKRFIDATKDVKKAIQDRAFAFGLVVSQLGSGVKSAKDLDRLLRGIEPKAVGAGSLYGALESGGLKLEPRQHGGPVQAGRPYVVGERQPELFVPRQSGTILPSVGGGMNVTIQAGAFMGTQVEARKFAKMIMDAYSDLQTSRGMA